MRVRPLRLPGGIGVGRCPQLRLEVFVADHFGGCCNYPAFSVEQRDQQRMVEPPIREATVANAKQRGYPACIRFLH